MQQLSPTAADLPFSDKDRFGDVPEPDDIPAAARSKRSKRSKAAPEAAPAAPEAAPEAAPAAPEAALDAAPESVTLNGVRVRNVQVVPWEAADDKRCADDARAWRVVGRALVEFDGGGIANGLVLDDTSELLVVVWERPPAGGPGRFALVPVTSSSYVR